MESFVFDDVLKFSQTSYLIKTLNSEAQKRIISSVFCEGSLINSRYVEYNGLLKEEQVFAKVKSYHEISKSDLNTLFKLSKKYAHSKEVGKRILLGRAFMKNKMYAEATNEFTSLININPNLSNIFYHMGQVRFNLGEFDQAALYFSRAIELNENFTDYHFYLGRAYLSQQKCKRAIYEFMQAIKLNSYYSDGYYYLGLAYLRNAIVKESYELAKDVVQNTEICFTKAAQIYPDFKNDYFLWLNWLS